MIIAQAQIANPAPDLPLLPGWVSSVRVEGLEDAAFASGAALAHLSGILAREDLPQSLLRDRLALRAAEVSVSFAGRPERAADLRDALHLMRTGDLPGPAGETYLAWRRATERPVSAKALHRALPGFNADTLAFWLNGARGAAVARAAAVLETVMADTPRAEGAAMLLADAALAQALGWEHLLPLLAIGLRRTDLRKQGDDLRLACHRAELAAVIEALPLAADLLRKAAKLRAVAPKLRAKAAGAAVQIFLSRDAVAPSALPLPDRAARRLCDRLVELGVVRELTGRDSFRLYGV